ncbi:hypothetical protein ACLD0U_14330 [Microbacterium sp. 2216-1]|uniref:hypothetical protein n=1 Tax=Microbacterium sp. 2216-1 TaxID=3390053 RepID=UPI003975B618
MEWTRVRAGRCSGPRARTVAAYRDRYAITDPTPLGTQAQDDAQKIDAARAGAAIDRVRRILDAGGQSQEPAIRTGSTRVGPML